MRFKDYWVKKKEVFCQGKLDDLTRDQLIDLWGRENLYAEEFSISKGIFVDLLFLSIYGAVIIFSTSEGFDEARRKIKELFGLNDGQIRFYVSRDEGCYRASSKGLEPVEDIYIECEDVFENINDVDSCNGGLSHRQVIDDRLLSRVYMMAKNLEKSGDNGIYDTYVDEDDREFIKKDSGVRLFGFDVGIVGNREWYQVSEIDSDSIALKMALFGWFGYHKFVLGEIWEGLFYFFTCGGAGLLAFLDLVQLCLGDFSYRQSFYEEDGTIVSGRLYLRKVGDKKIAFISLLISAAVGAFATLVIYRYGLKGVSGLIASIAERADEQTVYGIARKIS